jgi:hypothetical protein
MNRIECAILRTVLYADIFHYPMSAAEIHHFLIHDEAVTRAIVDDRLQNSPQLRQMLHEEGGYYARYDRAEIIALRHQREQAAAGLWVQAIKYGRWLARLPFVRMVAVTGALSMHNADEDDDLDYMIVTEPGRVWLARLFAVMLVRVVKIRGPLLCPNYVVASTALEQTRHDLFIAHEIVQMIPLYGQDIYEHMREINRWSDAEMPNAVKPFHDVERVTTGVLWSLLKRGMETMLGGRLGQRMEQWEHQRKLKRFADALETPHSAAQIDETQVKGHFNDYGHGVLLEYYERLNEFGLHELPATGD